LIFSPPGRYSLDGLIAPRVGIPNAHLLEQEATKRLTSTSLALPRPVNEVRDAPRASGQCPACRLAPGAVQAGCPVPRGRRRRPLLDRQEACRASLEPRPRASLEARGCRPSESQA